MTAITFFMVVAIAATSVHAVPLDVMFFDMDSAVKTQQLNYEEQLLAFVFQGLINDASLKQPQLMLNAGYMNFDWPGSDMYWNGYFTKEKRVNFKNVTDMTLCGLVNEADPTKRIKGAVAYDPTLANGNAREWAIPIAVTVAAQESLLPVTDAMRSKFPCLGSLKIVKDLRKMSWAADRSKAWDWAFETLLAGSSKTVAYNLYHYQPQIVQDPQSNATLANIDFAVQQKAFIMNFKTTGNPAKEVNPLFSRALAKMDPLFSAYGWTDNEFGFVWMTQSSGASPNGTADDAAAGGGGAVFCSFATPNLSFWKLLPIPGRTKSRALPIYDRNMTLDKNKTYVLLETNEGDTPRIVVSAFSKSWTDPRRGSLPVSWSIDPALGDQFPALFDYFASTASVNDSFISGPGGCGYVYYGRMTDAQIKTFATRCGRLMKEYGPAIIDTFGQTGTKENTISVLTNFSRYAAVGGVAPQMYITHPTGNIKYSYFQCDQTQLDMWQPDGTPLVCTAHGKDNLFYIPGCMHHPKCPSCELSRRINEVAAANKPPFFITVYGGLKWTASSQYPLEEFWTLWTNTIDKLDKNIIPVGAQEMARLAREARVLL